ncbi:MAG: hypothetical protein LUO89_14415, partial [Methanothrix sp.]|nr:hypothetical protein [Methanothrix sp.]
AKPERLMQQAEPPPAGVLSKEKKSSARAEGYLSDRLEQRPSAAAAEVAPEPMQREAKPLGSIKEEAGGANQSPEAWLIRIKRLKQEGRLDEARKELAAFKKRYPGYTVPPDLEVR